MRQVSDTICTYTGGVRVLPLRLCICMHQVVQLAKTVLNADLLHAEIEHLRGAPQYSHHLGTSHIGPRNHFQDCARNELPYASSNHSFTHSLTHSQTDSLAHWLTDSLTHSLTHSLTAGASPFSSSARTECTYVTAKQ